MQSEVAKGLYSKGPTVYAGQKWDWEFNQSNDFGGNKWFKQY